MTSKNEDYEKARAGDREALGRILARFEGRIASLAEQRTGAELRARLRVSDVVQSAFVEVVDAIEQFRGDTDEEFYGWATRILENKVRRKGRFFRAKKRWGEEEQRELDAAIYAADEGLPTPSVELAKSENFARVMVALDRLPEDYRNVLILRGVEGKGHHEISELLGRTPAATRMLLSRARVALTVELDRMDADGDFFDDPKD